ncbi:MAG: glycosyltransferase family 2 protein [Zhenhengia sp.]|uniref:glycosyltransferase family 2 protein n=1 Tax=Zhenhengia sp. TaxID=2944208 RepID=UPI003992FCC0
MFKVSVIVPVYNVERFLSKCIDSLLRQTLQDIEIILIDDGATDRSSEICDTYALKDHRIKVIHKINGGLSDARNVGIEVAQGEYIAFLDSDDWVEPNLYEYLYNLIKKKNADIAQCDYIKAYAEDAQIDFKHQTKETIYTSVEALGLLFGEEYVKTVVVWNKLYRRSLFEEIRFPKGKVHEDEFTTYKVIHKANKLVNSNLPKVYYRQREGSIMAEGFNEKRLHILEAYKEKYAYLKQEGLEELALRTEVNLCSTLKKFYVQTRKSKLVNKSKILKDLRNDMRRNYMKFIKNPYITNRGKMTLTICLLNGYIFCLLYYHISRMNYEALGSSI